MSASPATREFIDSQFSRINAAIGVIRNEAAALDRLATRLPAGFSAAVDLLLQCSGNVIVSGMGKAGWIGQKLSASFASTGTRSHFLHPAEAIHGDLGRIGDQDVVVALSNSGETDEITRILPSLARRKISVIAITANAGSTLGKSAQVVLDYGRVAEAGHLGLAPSTTTAVMLALGDALALVTSQVKNFTPRDFATHHPGGTLGRKLATVDELMRPIDQCRIAKTNESIRDIYVRSSVAERRVGVILVTDSESKLAGVFTDSDLARLLERRRDAALDQPISNVMTANPITVTSGDRASVAIDILASRNISELPVIDDAGHPLGIIDITDVISLMPVQA